MRTLDSIEGSCVFASEEGRQARCGVLTVTSPLRREWACRTPRELRDSSGKATGRQTHSEGSRGIPARLAGVN